MNKTRKAILWGLWLPVGLYAAVIFLLSSFPQPEMPVKFWGLDKILHLAEYGLFGILLARAIKGTAPAIRLNRLYLWVAIVALTYGITDELHQLFVPGRVVSGWDVLSDGLGGFLGALLIRVHPSSDKRL